MDDLEKIEELEKELAKLKEKVLGKAKYPYWIPECGESFWFLNVNTVLDEVYYPDMERYRPDKSNLLSTGWVYKEDQIDLINYDIKKMLARQRIQMAADKMHGKRISVKVGECVWYIVKNRSNGYLTTDKSGYYSADVVPYLSNELAKKALDICRKDYNILHDIKV